MKTAEHQYPDPRLIRWMNNHCFEVQWMFGDRNIPKSEALLQLTYTETVPIITVKIKSVCDSIFGIHSPQWTNTTHVLTIISGTINELQEIEINKSAEISFLATKIEIITGGPIPMELAVQKRVKLSVRVILDGHLSRMLTDLKILKAKSVSNDSLYCNAREMYQFQYQEIRDAYLEYLARQVDAFLVGTGSGEVTLF